MDEITKHHLQNLADKNYIENEDGSISTVKTIIVNIDGEETLIPSLWDGKILSPEDAAKKAIESGKNWPSISATKDNAIEKLNEFDKEIHKNFKPLTSNKAKKILSIGERYTPTNQFDSLALEIIEGNKNKKETYGVGEDKNYQTITPVTEDNPLSKFTDKYLRFGKDNNIQINPDLFGAEKGFNVKIIQNKAKGGEVMEKPTEEQQMEMMLEGGGLKDEGGTTDPVSGNEVPNGATQKGVRDDVPAMLSEGEYVMNEASTRYHGVDKFNQMQEEAKQGYAQMEQDGLMGEPVDDTEEALPFGMADLNVSDEEGRELMMAEGGDVSTQRKLLQDDIDSDVFNVLRRKQPTFGESMGGSGLQFKQYKNADGMNVMIPFINGVPMFSIPEGYELVDPNDPDATPVPQPVVPKEEVLEPVGPPEAGGDQDVKDIVTFDTMSPEQRQQARDFYNKDSKAKSLLQRIPIVRDLLAMNEKALRDYDKKTLATDVKTETKKRDMKTAIAEAEAEQKQRTIASREAEKAASTIAGPTGGSQRTSSTQSPRGGIATPGYTQADTSSPTMNFNDPSEAAEYNAAVDAATDFAGAAEAGGTGDVGGGPGQGDAPSGETAGDYGYFNKGGLAGKKPKKKMKTYKKGGLATSKK